MSFETRYRLRVFLLRLRRSWSKVESRVIRLLFAFCLSILHLAIYPRFLGERFETYLHDFWQRVSPLDPKQAPVVIVAFDKSSAQKFGVSNLEPWPRSYHTRLLDRLKQENPKRIFLDFFMTHPGSDASVDADLARALRESKASIGKYTQDSFVVLADGSREFRSEEVTPLPLFAESARSVVSMHVWSNREVDGVVRHITSPLNVSIEKKLPLWPELVGENNDSRTPPGVRDFIAYYGQAGSLPRVSLSQVLLSPESLPPNFFRDKVVLVGPSMQTTFQREEEKDTFVTPFPHSRMNGVEIHASVAANILQRSWVSRASLLAETLLLSLLCFGLIYLLALLRIAIAFFAMLTLTAFWLLASYTLYKYSFFLPGALLFLLILPVSWSLLGLIYYLKTNRKLQTIESTIGIRLET